MKNYENFYSDSAKKLKASEIRELLKLIDKPDMISFAGGLPNPNAFPLDKMKPIIEHVMNEHGRDALQYGQTEGHNKLRDVIARGMKKNYEVSQEINNIIITNGSQEALNLLCKIFINPGDSVLTSNPTYLGGILVFNSFQAQINTVPIDEFGIRVDILEERLKELSKKNNLPKLIYLIPTFQNPTGVTIPKERREKIYELICKYNLLLIEDDPYGLLRYEGFNEPLIKKYDAEDRVIYLGTFSKILAPGFRVGWISADDKIVNKVCLAKQAEDLCTNTFGQYCVFEAIYHDILFPHIKEIISYYKKKRDLMLKIMEESFPTSKVKWNKPEGGLFIWVTLPEILDSLELLTKAIDNNVAYVIGSPFFPNGGGNNTFRLNFSYASDDRIEEGIKRLSKVIKLELKKLSENLKNDKIDIF